MVSVQLAAAARVAGQFCVKGKLVLFVPVTEMLLIKSEPVPVFVITRKPGVLSLLTISLPIYREE
jgi:hypothetical protein